MYKNNRSRHGHGNGGYRGRGDGRGYRTKTFDPSHIVGRVQIPTNGQEVDEEVKHSFSDFALPETLKNKIAERGFVVPTPVQDKAIPEILLGSDVVGIANTGTGKTAAFLIPLIAKAMQSTRNRVLIITPTRELAAQIEDELSQLVRNLKIFSAVCIGGVSLRGQIGILRKSPQFVIGTPGRLLDLSRQNHLYFQHFDSVVLDEVDRMLEMGFINDVQTIISDLPKNRQSLFFSATLPDSVKSTMRQFTLNPIVISVKKQDMLSNVHQDVVHVQGRDKVNILADMLDRKEFKKVLVFGRTKRGAENLFRQLAHMGFKAAAIHGNKNQSQRRRSLESFKGGEVNVLIATDVVARGIDVEDITHVINYELPESYEDYLHRIGRTGRAGKQGVALTFVG